MERLAVPARLSSARCIVRHPANPVLSSRDVPFPSVNVYNAGVARLGGRYVTVFRNDHGFDRQAFEEACAGRREWPVQINLGIARSDDGARWEVEPTPIAASEPAEFARLAGLPAGEVLRVYDPRITVVEGRPHLCLAVDTRHGLRGAVVAADDSLRQWTVLDLTVPDNRNMVLFPSRIGGAYVRLERPFPVYSRGGQDRFEMWLSRSPDLRHWGRSALVLAVEQVPFANDKLGPAAPPVLTERGWLTVFHAVDRDDTRGKNGWEPKWTKRYTAGVCLLDRDDPSKVVAMSKAPLIAPEAPYETVDGYRDNVIFPCGLAVEDGGLVKIWYGASDHVLALATCRLDELLALCDSPA